MKNLNFFPFERNHYYYGKLLTEVDFLQEQQYMNDKRRMLNRFIHGVGIAAGLNVVSVDEKSISVEEGIAIDFAGREIVIDRPLIRSIDKIDGFDTLITQNKSYAYLCLEYDEHLSVPAHNIVRNIQEDFDKCKESYHLYLSDQEPNYLPCLAKDFYEDTYLLYEDESVRIFQIMPRIVLSGSMMEIEYRIENIAQTRRIQVNFEQKLIGATCNDQNVLSIEINEEIAAGDSISKRFPCRILYNGIGDINFKMGHLWLKNGASRKVEKPLFYETLKVAVKTQALVDELLKEYYRNAMNRYADNNYQQGIYLAKIYLTKTDQVYLIKEVKAYPLEQQVVPNYIQTGMIRLLEKQLAVLKQELALNKNEQPKHLNLSENTRTPMYEQGDVIIDLGIGGKRGQRYFSEEIFHHLGLGHVDIRLSVDYETFSLSGSSEVFENFDPKAELAVLQNIQKGSFIIGARLLETSKNQQMHIHWTAQRIYEEKSESGEMKLFIKPSSLELKVRDSYFLEAVAVNMNDPRVQWKVKSANGGLINEEGLYVAPNIAGIYEVCATSVENESIQASLFIVVRE